MQAAAAKFLLPQSSHFMARLAMGSSDKLIQSCFAASEPVLPVTVRLSQRLAWVSVELKLSTR